MLASGSWWMCWWWSKWSLERRERRWKRQALLDALPLERSEVGFAGPERDFLLWRMEMEFFLADEGPKMDLEGC